MPILSMPLTMPHPSGSLPFAAAVATPTKGYSGRGFACDAESAAARQKTQLFTLVYCWRIRAVGAAEASPPDQGLGDAVRDAPAAKPGLRSFLPTAASDQLRCRLRCVCKASDG